MTWETSNAELLAAEKAFFAILAAHTTGRARDTVKEEVKSRRVVVAWVWLKVTDALSSPGDWTVPVECYEFI